MLQVHEQTLLLLFRYETDDGTFQCFSSQR